MAIQTIKGITRGPWGAQEHTHAPWYQPLTEPKDIATAVHWVLGRPDFFLNAIGDLSLLPAVFEAAARFERCPSDAEMAELVARERMTTLFP